MNKKLLAVAIATAVTTVPLAAQAETDLKIYGGVGIAVESIDIGTAGDALAVNNNHSAIGFEGSSDINADLAAVFHWDAFVNLDGANGGALINGGRDGWAGVKGGFGTVALGFQGRPWKTLSHGLDPFEGTIADYSSVLGNTGNNGSGATGYFDGGIGNSVIWFGPNIDGLSWHLQYGAEDDVGNGNNTGLQVNYTMDALFVGGSYDVNDGGTSEDETAMKLVGSYNMDAITLTAAYENIAGANNTAGADRDAFWLAATMKMDGGSIRAAYTSASELDSAADTGGDQISLGYFADLSDNAMWYVIYSAISNDAAGTYEFVSAPHTSEHSLASPGAGEDSDVIALGFKYNFSADLM